MERLISLLKSEPDGATARALAAENAKVTILAEKGGRGAVR